MHSLASAANQTQRLSTGGGVGVVSSGAMSSEQRAREAEDKLAALQQKVQVLMAKFREQQAELDKWKEVANKAVLRLKDVQNGGDLAAKLAAAERRAREAELIARSVDELKALAPVQGQDRPSTVLRFVDAVHEQLKKLEARSVGMQPLPKVITDDQEEEEEQQEHSNNRSLNNSGEGAAARAASEARIRQLETELAEAKTKIKGMLTVAEAAERTAAVRAKVEEAVDVARRFAQERDSWKGQYAEAELRVAELEQKLKASEQEAKDRKHQLNQAAEALARGNAELRRQAAMLSDRQELEGKTLHMSREKDEQLGSTLQQLHQVQEKAAKNEEELKEARAQNAALAAERDALTRRLQDIVNKITRSQAARAAQVGQEGEISEEEGESEESANSFIEKDDAPAVAVVPPAVTVVASPPVVDGPVEPQLKSRDSIGTNGAASHPSPVAVEAAVNADPIKSTADANDRGSSSRASDALRISDELSAALSEIAAASSPLRATPSRPVPPPPVKMSLPLEQLEEGYGEAAEDGGSVEVKDEELPLDEEDGAPPPPTRPAWMDEAKTAQEAAERRAMEKVQSSPQLSPQQDEESTTPRSRRRQLLNKELRKGTVFNDGKKKDGEGSPAPVPLQSSPGGSGAAAPPSSSGGAVPLREDGKKKSLGIDSLSSILQALTPKALRHPAGTPSGSNSNLSVSTGSIKEGGGGGGGGSGSGSTKNSPNVARKKKSADKTLLSHISPKQARKAQQALAQHQDEADGTTSDTLDRDYAVVMFDYVAEREGELSLKRGDRIVLYGVDDSGFWKGRDPKGRVGLFPSNRVSVNLEKQTSPSGSPREGGGVIVTPFDATAELSPVVGRPVSGVLSGAALQQVQNGGGPSGGSGSSSTGGTRSSRSSSLGFSPGSPRTGIERPPEIDPDNSNVQLVLPRLREFRVLEVQVFQAMNLELKPEECVYLEFNDGKQLFQTSMGRQSADGVAFGDEFRFVADRNRLGKTEPLSCRMIAVTPNGREDLIGIVQIPVQECVWEDAMWTSMKWCPVLGVLQEVRGIVQVIMRRTTARSAWSYVAPRCGEECLQRTSPFYTRQAIFKQLQQPISEADATAVLVAGATGLSQLQQACNEAKPDLAAIAQLVEDGHSFDVEWRNARRQTLLHLLAAGGFTALCRLCVTLGAKCGAVDRWGNTALHYACLYGHWDCARLLLSKGAVCSALNNLNCSPLHMALLFKPAVDDTPHISMDLFRALLDAGGDASVRSNYGATVLHCLVYSLGHLPVALSMAGLLLDRGCPTNAPDDEGCSPFLLWLLMHWSSDDVDFATQWSRALRQVPGGGVGDAPETTEERTHRITMSLTPDQRGDTVLWRMLATARAPRDVINNPLMLELVGKAQINRRYGLYGNTLFLRCCMSLDDPVPFCSFLLDSRPDLDPRLASSKGFTALHILAARGDDALIPLARRLCEDFRCDVNAPDGMGHSPLHFCSTPGMARLFLAHGARTDLVSSTGLTTLHSAFALGDQALIDLLLSSLKKDDHPVLYARSRDNQLPSHMLFNKGKIVTIPHYASDAFASRANGLYLGHPPTVLPV